MKLTPEQRENILVQYKEWADKLFDDLDWVESIQPETFVSKIIDLVEEANGSI